VPGRTVQIRVIKMGVVCVLVDVVDEVDVVAAV